ncbi:hypothetical protein BaRGS_00019070, partial [Batillaria attramentaria]
MHVQLVLVSACSCQHGECDGGPLGSGKCKPGSCYAGFTGDNCDREKKRCYGRQLLCHLHAECVLDDDNKPRCDCQAGYEGDGQMCEEVDPCEKPDRGRCHAQATCSKIGPGAHKCECDRGWFGDGFTCHPVTPCTSEQDCHGNASCHNLRPGEYSCMCNKGFEGNGTLCLEVDACLKDNGGCDILANCTPTGPGTVNCTCPKNYVGNGQRCFTTIAGHILAHENLTALASLLKCTKYLHCCCNAPNLNFQRLQLTVTAFDLTTDVGPDYRVAGRGPIQLDRGSFTV